MGLTPLPTGLPGWASGAAATNIAQPTAQQMAEGWAVGQAPASSYENYLKSLTYSWLSYANPRVVTYTETMMHRGTVGGPTSFTGGLPNYGQLAVVMSPSAVGYSMIDPYINYPFRSLRLGKGEQPTQYAYACSPGVVYIPYSGIDCELTVDFKPALQDVNWEVNRIGLFNSRVGHSGTHYVALICPTNTHSQNIMPWWLAVRNGTTGTSAMIATGYGATSVMRNFRLFIEPTNGRTTAYIDDIQVQQVNLAPSGIGLYLSAGIQTNDVGVIPELCPDVGPFKIRVG